MMHYQKWQSPIGPLHLAADDRGLRALAFDANWPRVREKLGAELTEAPHPVIAQVLHELREYFAGERRQFSVKLAPIGTDFQNLAWRALREIPYGETRTYGAQAKAIAKPRAIRAVGRANGLNPLAIVVPCHRVVGASGSLTGFAGGLDAKESLLALEKKALARARAAG